MSGHDAMTIGAGINGTVAAELTGTGWSMSLHDAGEETGGFVASEQPDTPGYVRGPDSRCPPLLVTGSAYPAPGDDLARHRRNYCNTGGAVTASMVTDGRTSTAYQEPDASAGQFDSTVDNERHRAVLRRLCEDTPATGQRRRQLITRNGGRR